MKVALRLTVEVDPDEWAEEYGVQPFQVREDVRRYVANLIVTGDEYGLLTLVNEP